MGSISEVAPATKVRARRRTGRLRLTRTGLSTFVFLLPFLVIFGVFGFNGLKSSRPHM